MGVTANTILMFEKIHLFLIRMGFLEKGENSALTALKSAASGLSLIHISFRLQLFQSGLQGFLGPFQLFHREASVSYTHLRLLLMEQQGRSCRTADSRDFVSHPQVGIESSLGNIAVHMDQRILVEMCIRDSRINVRRSLSFLLAYIFNAP